MVTRFVWQLLERRHAGEERVDALALERAPEVVHAVDGLGDGDAAAVPPAILVTSRRVVRRKRQCGAGCPSTDSTSQ